MGKLEDLLEFQNEHIETKIVFYDSSWNSTFLFGAQDLNIKLTMSFKFHWLSVIVESPLVIYLNCLLNGTTSPYSAVCDINRPFHLHNQLDQHVTH